MDFVATLTIAANETLWRACDVPVLTAAALHPVPDLPHRILLRAAEKGHWAALRRAVDEGVIEARDRISMCLAEPHAQLEAIMLTRDALTKFCESLRIRVVAADPGPPPVVEFSGDQNLTVTRLVEAIAATIKPDDRWGRNTPEVHAANEVLSFLDRRQLQPRHPETLERLSSWNRDELLNAVLLPDEARTILEQHGIELRQIRATASDPAVEATSANVGPSGSPSGRPDPLLIFQEKEILRVIEKLGHRPKALPKTEPGKRGIKWAVRNELKSLSKAVFNKAWQRLRDDDELTEG
jgi:hypothetical protein